MKLLSGRALIRYLAFTLIFTLVNLLAACSQGAEAIGVGQTAPEFSLPTADGGSVALDDFTGHQPVLLYFHMAVG
jgi:hypothetical protein